MYISAQMNALRDLKSYCEAEAWLHSITDYEKLLGNSDVRYDTRHFDLERFAEKLQRMGNPQYNYAVIHVAGTKGKGSTCALLEAALRKCGYRTGLYTSPHLVRFTERMRVNGAEISDADFCRYLMKTRSMVMPDPQEAQKSFRTVFEILTASAFAYFADQQVEVAVIETGLGGRLDSTNVFSAAGEHPLVSVITSIGLDHTAILGNTIEAISTEKAGIIHRRSRVVVAPQASPQVEAAVRKTVTDRCAAVGAPDPVFAGDVIRAVKQPASQDCWAVQAVRPQRGDGRFARDLASGATVCPSLKGEHQLGNVSAALAALETLSDAWGTAGERLTLAGACKGFANTTWPGRFETRKIAGIDAVVDGAHCGLSAAALGRACNKYFGNRPAVIITGFLRDKAGAEMVQAFATHVNVAHAIAAVPASERSLPADEIYSVLQQEFGADKASRAPNITEALHQAVAIARDIPDAYVVVFGSLYLIGPALSYQAET